MANTLLPNESPFVLQWSREAQVLAAFIVQDQKTIGFALMHKTDSDPLGQYRNPYVLDYIYIAPRYRGQGYAIRLLKEVKGKYEVTCFPSTSSRVFLRAEYKTRYWNNMKVCRSC